MTFDEFITERSVKIKDDEHRKVIRLFYPYLKSVSGDKRLLPSLLEKILNIDLNDVTVVTGCFNGINDNTNPPYDNVDFYIKLSNNMRIFVYGRKIREEVKLKENEYVIFVVFHEITGDIVRKESRHIFLKQSIT